MKCTPFKDWEDNFILPDFINGCAAIFTSLIHKNCLTSCKNPFFKLLFSNNSLRVNAVRVKQLQRVDCGMLLLSWVISQTLLYSNLL